jgi:acyl-CoA thioester hydrolase
MITSLPVRVYYEDTDAGGVVYHASYLKFSERARTEFLRTIGFDHNGVLQNHGAYFVVRHIDASFNRPALLDDCLIVETSVSYIKNASFAMKQTILRDNVSLFDMTVILACINAEGKPLRIPDDIKTALAL